MITYRDEIVEKGAYRQVNKGLLCSLCFWFGLGVFFTVALVCSTEMEWLWREDRQLLILLMWFLVLQTAVFSCILRFVYDKMIYRIWYSQEEEKYSKCTGMRGLQILAKLVKYIGNIIRAGALLILGTSYYTLRLEDAFTMLVWKAFLVVVFISVGFDLCESCFGKVRERRVISVVVFLWWLLMICVLRTGRQT